MAQGNADQQLGALGARVTNIEQDILRMDEKIERQLEQLSTKVGNVHDAMIAAKGGWRTLTALGVIVAALGSAFGYVLHLLFNRS